MKNIKKSAIEIKKIDRIILRKKLTKISKSLFILTMLSFDKNIIWKNIYRRNNRTKFQKHILCFPDHYDGRHIV